MFQHSQVTHKNFKFAAYGLLALVAIFIFLSFQQYGLSNDEPVQHEYGRLLLDFYLSGFVDQDAFHYVNLYLYGGLFDLVAAILEKILPYHVWDIRHFLSAMFGWAGLLAVYKIAKELAGARAGFVAVLLLALTGAWIGAMFTHTKDIPFATCMAWALYYTVLAAERFPKIPLAIAVKLGIAIGCALGLRVGGGFAVIYLFLTLIYASLKVDAQMKTCLLFFRQGFTYLLPIAAVAFILMAIFWPWGVMSPTHPFEAIRAFSHFSFDMTTVVRGVVVNIGEVPPTYLLDYLSVRLPEAFLLGVISFIIFGLLHINMPLTLLNPKKYVGYVAVVIAVVFPIVFVLFTKPALYNGVRHFTFILPPLAVIAALGVEKFWLHLKRIPAIHYLFTGVFSALCALTLLKLAQFHPYEYVVYNQLAGPTKSLAKNWETDYWSSGMRETAIMLNQLALPPRKKPYLVATCTDYVQGGAYLDKRFEVTRNWAIADFFMSTTQNQCDTAMQGKIIGEVKRLGLTLTVLKDRRHLQGEDRIPRMTIGG
jgi:hypothetical protein